MEFECTGIHSVFELPDTSALLASDKTCIKATGVLGRRRQRFEAIVPEFGTGTIRPRTLMSPYV